MHVNRSLVDFGSVTPHTIEQLRTAKNATGIGHEKFKEPILSRAEVQNPPKSAHSVSRSIQRQSIPFEHVGHKIGRCPSK